MTSGILYYAAPTPNGHKVYVFLEELKAAYGLEYESVIILACFRERFSPQS